MNCASVDSMQIFFVALTAEVKKKKKGLPAEGPTSAGPLIFS